MAGQPLQKDMEQWERFVRYMEHKADKSLVSLLRNSVILEISQQNLTIGLQNTSLFNEEKRLLIESFAHEFFSRDLVVSYRDSVDGIDDSVCEKLEQEQIKDEEEKRRQAAEDSLVKQVLAVFPRSRIKSIEILEEKRDV